MMLERGGIERVLGSHRPRTLADETLRPAAVLIPLFAKNGEDHLLFTRRTEHLPHHKGEISFPGGGQDKQDEGPLGAALRESEEEMGICPADVTVLGRLDDVYSIHGYRVTPFVATIPYPYPFLVNRHEIADVLELPLRAFLDPTVYRLEDWSFKGRTHPVRFYKVQGEEVWGMTAEILHQFLTLVAPLADRA